MSRRHRFEDMVKSVEERFVPRWISGVGKDAKFDSDSVGWYVVFASCPASMHFGSERPDYEVGDRVRLTIEKV